MSIINLTPHDVVLLDDRGGRITIPSSGRAAVNTTSGVPLRFTADIPIYSPNQYGKVDGLPEAVDEGDVIVVSSICAAAIAIEVAQLRAELDVALADPRSIDDTDRAKLDRLTVLRACVSPGTGQNDCPERDERGQITAVRRLIAAVP